MSQILYLESCILYLVSCIYRSHCITAKIRNTRTETREKLNTFLKRLQFDVLSTFVQVINSGSWDDGELHEDKDDRSDNEVLSLCQDIVYSVTQG